MSATRWLATAFTVAALAAAGCGGDDEESTQPAGGGGGDTASAGGGGGKELFSNTCGGCHTLKAAGTGGQVGPNLDELKPDVERVKQAIAQGPGVMPENLYEGAEADAVAQFVADSAGK